eukprot:TRINITY_DN3861_c0_g2_i2.p1 TRINITY_DN3861_c0_g2~~TRINITY_DN3861_c0_g2_i2.p1  ORF type:complete len:390 (-),score=74.05 TRINITY_DN3861_c0_g2_i2:33-1076(-)
MEPSSPPIITAMTKVDIVHGGDVISVKLPSKPDLCVRDVATKLQEIYPLDHKDLPIFLIEEKVITNDVLLSSLVEEDPSYVLTALRRTSPSLASPSYPLSPKLPQAAPPSPSYSMSTNAIKQKGGGGGTLRGKRMARKSLIYAEGMAQIKLVVVGDSGIGKTSLLFSYYSNSFPNKDFPAIFYNSASLINVDGKNVNLDLWDTAAQEDLMKTRTKNNTDVFVLCFSLNNRDSFLNVLNVWGPELTFMCPHVPIILVGLKEDLRAGAAAGGGGDNSSVTTSSSLATIISLEEGESMARKVGAVKYMECSSLSRKGLSVVFEESVRAVFEAETNWWREKSRKKANCIVQ